MSKTYKWADPGDKGKIRHVKIEDVCIDYSYQREEIPVQIMKIAKNFNWTAFGMPVLMQRKNGHNYIVDGQQRMLAALKRGIKHIPCIIFQSTRGASQEAEAFSDLNANRRNISSIDKFKSAVTAKRSPEVDINKWLQEKGFKVDKSHSDKSIRFPNVLIRLWKINEKASKSSLLTQRTICGDEALNSSIHRGMWYLYHNEIKVDTFIDKIIRSGGIARLLQAIRAIEINEVAVERYLSNNRLFAMSILQVINKGRRRKIKLPIEKEEESA